MNLHKHTICSLIFIFHETTYSTHTPSITFNSKQYFKIALLIANKVLKRYSSIHEAHVLLHIQLFAAMVLPSTLFIWYFLQFNGLLSHTIKITTIITIFCGFYKSFKISFGNLMKKFCLLLVKIITSKEGQSTFSPTWIPRGIDRLVFILKAKS